MADEPVEVPKHWSAGMVLGRKDVAEIFNVTPETVGRWARSGMIGFFRTPRGNRCYPECEVDRMRNGEPVPDIVIQLAEQDRKNYQKKWREGWRQNPHTVANWLAAREKEEGDAA